MAAKTISEDLSYYIKVDNKKRRLEHDEQQPQCNSCSSTTTTTTVATKHLAQAWLALQNKTRVRSGILATMARLKRQLLFSIDIFVDELNLTSLPTPELASMLMVYHTWSRQAHGMMPLISFLLPLIVQEPNTLIQH
ncbi:unnamed protein product [Absidia cylindrospora]